MNQKIDELITAVLAFATANPGAPPLGVVDTTEEASARARADAVALACVRLVKRFANQQTTDESSLLVPAIRRLANRHGALDLALNNAKQAALVTNAAAIAAAAAAVNVPE